MEYNHVPIFLITSLFVKDSEVKWRKFYRFEYAYSQNVNGQYLGGRLIGIVIVEAANVDDMQGATWSIQEIHAYQYLKDLDQLYLDRKSNGVLSAGPHFMLYEVVGDKNPRFLIRDEANPTNLLDDNTSIQLEEEIERIKACAMSGGCKQCPFQECSQFKSNLAYYTLNPNIRRNENSFDINYEV